MHHQSCSYGLTWHQGGRRNHQNYNPNESKCSSLESVPQGTYLGLSIGAYAQIGRPQLARKTIRNKEKSQNPGKINSPWNMWELPIAYDRRSGQTPFQRQARCPANVGRDSFSYWNRVAFEFLETLGTTILLLGWPWDFRAEEKNWKLRKRKYKAEKVFVRLQKYSVREIGENFQFEVHDFQTGGAHHQTSQTAKWNIKQSAGRGVQFFRVENTQ